MLFDEPSEGAAYLSALKKSDPQAAGTATAHAPGVPHAAEAKTQSGGSRLISKASVAKPDKRRTPRYKCKGSARLQQSDGGVSTWAMFADISVHGCYIETPAPMRVGALMGLKLEANGFRVEATGEVRTSYPGLGMGVLFTRISEPDGERLRELVQSFSQSSVRTQAMTKPDALRAVTNAHAVLQAMLNFFEDRHMMGREEFQQILRKSQ